MLGFRLEHNGEVVVRQIEDVAVRIRDPRPVLEDFGEHMVETSIPETFRQGGRPERWAESKWSADRTQMDTGRLLRSVQHEVSARALRIGTNLKYAQQRHFGGTIEPKSAKAIPVPMPDVPRSMRRPRRWGDRLFFLESKKGDKDTVGLLASKGRRGQAIVRFVLRRRVTQPARPFLVVQDDDWALFSRRLAQYAFTGELS